MWRQPPPGRRAATASWTPRAPSLVLEAEASPPPPRAFVIMQHHLLKRWNWMYPRQSAIENHDNIMQVPGLYELRVAPKAGSDLKIPIGKLAMEILSGQRFKEAQTDPFAKARKSARNNPFIGADKDSGSAFARQSVLRGHAMYNFLVRMLTVMSMLDSRAEVRENTIKFFMETEFCEFAPELEEHFEFFEHIRGFNVTVVTSADTKEETSLLWSGFMLNDEGETK